MLALYYIGRALLGGLLALLGGLLALLGGLLAAGMLPGEHGNVTS